MRTETSHLYKVTAVLNGIKQTVYFVADDIEQIRENFKLTAGRFDILLSVESIHVVNLFVEGGQ